MAPLHNEKTTLHKEKVELEGKLNQVKQRMSCVEKSIKTKQRILDDKSSLLKASEIIESDGDVVELIRLAEQTCGELSSFIPALDSQNVKNCAFKSPQVFVLHLSISYSIHVMQ